MFISSINNKAAQVRTEANIVHETTKLNLKGSFLDIEGYIYTEGIQTTSEAKIRKTLLFVKEIDLKSYKEEYEMKNLNQTEETDEEIIEKHTIEVPLENYWLSDINLNDSLLSKDKILHNLVGYKASINLSKIIDDKPLNEGKYYVYIRLEQMPDDNDNIIYMKTSPLANAKEFLGKNLVTTHLNYFSTKRIRKYNLVADFDTYHKTLCFNNVLLQSYNPEDLKDEDVSKENKYVQAIKRRFFKLSYSLFSILPAKKNKITFASDSRTELNGNMYFIYEELYKRGLDLNIKFKFNEKIQQKKSYIELLNTAYHFATSKIILLDDFYPLIYPLNIRKSTDLIQIWHAAGAFKTFGFSRVGRPGGPTPKSRNHRNYTKATVSSQGVRGHYAEGFGISEEKVYATGVPRSDIFKDEKYIEYVQNTLKNKYPFINGKKVILFAPTFRGHGQASAYFPFETINFKHLYDTLHEDYVFLFKIHPFVNNKLDIPYEYSDFFYDLSDFREINDLLLITDILITDYSSVCFEFALLNKPMIFFAFDVETYIQERDFYYDYFNFIPGPLVRTTSEIIKSIENNDFEMEKIPQFVNYFFDDTVGQASKNVVDDIIIPSLNKLKENEVDPISVMEPPKSRLELFERTLSEYEQE